MEKEGTGRAAGANQRGGGVGEGGERWDEARTRGGHERLNTVIQSVVKCGPALLVTKEEGEGGGGVPEGGCQTLPAR